MLIAAQPHNAPALHSASAEAIKELLKEGESLNTVASYQSASRYWGEWYKLRYGTPIALPLPVACVLQFVIDHAQRTTASGTLANELPPEIDAALQAKGVKGKRGPLAHATLTHRLAVMSKAHQLRGFVNPCHDVQVRELLTRTRRAYAKRGQVPQKKAALTKDLLGQLLATCDDSLRGQRDKAILLMAWSSGGRRRSEVVSAQMQALRRTGPAEFIYTLTHSKTNQTGLDLPENQKPVLGAAGMALQSWLQLSGITEGLIFRRILKGGHLGGAMASGAIRDIVQARCALAGVQGDFSAHSLRSGFVTEAGRQNISLADTMALTGHRSITTVMGYFRADSAAKNAGARLMG